MMETLLQLEGEAVSAYRHGGTYYVGYKGSAVLTDGHPQHICGSGSTIEEACLDYALKISGKTLVFRDCTAERREVNIIFILNGYIQLQEACFADDQEPPGGDCNARS
jgi:hypothetical protein